MFNDIIRVKGNKILAAVRKMCVNYGLCRWCDMQSQAWRKFIVFPWIIYVSMKVSMSRLLIIEALWWWFFVIKTLTFIANKPQYSSFAFDLKELVQSLSRNFNKRARTRLCFSRFLSPSRRSLSLCVPKFRQKYFSNERSKPCSCQKRVPPP